MTIRLVLAGCGNMGYAMLTGWLKSGKLAAGEPCSWSSPMPSCASAPPELGASVAADADDIPADAAPELVVLAVKPQVIREVTADYKRFGDGGTTFVSIAAGTPVATFEAHPRQRAPIDPLHAQHAGGDRQGHDGGLLPTRRYPTTTKALRRRAAVGQRRGRDDRR